MKKTSATSNASSSVGSMRAYARHRNVSAESVSKAVEDGRIREAVVGKQGRSILIDFEKADRLWGERTEPKMPPIGSGKAAKKVDPEESGKETYEDARTRKARADADVAERERDALLGLYLLTEDVTAQFRALGAMHSAAREALPTQLAPQLVGKTDLGDIEKILREALRKCDERVADEIRSRFGDLAGSEGA